VMAQRLDRALDVLAARRSSAEESTPTSVEDDMKFPVETHHNPDQADLIPRLPVSLLQDTGRAPAKSRVNADQLPELPRPPDSSRRHGSARNNIEPIPLPAFLHVAGPRISSIQRGHQLINDQCYRKPFRQNGCNVAFGCLGRQ